MKFKPNYHINKTIKKQSKRKKNQSNDGLMQGYYATTFQKSLSLTTILPSIKFVTNLPQNLAQYHCKTCKDFFCFLCWQNQVIAQKSQYFFYPNQHITKTPLKQAWPKRLEKSPWPIEKKRCNNEERMGQKMLYDKYTSLWMCPPWLPPSLSPSTTSPFI